MKPLKIVDELGIQGCFIAGGAILSAATKTEINDYDIYPKTEIAFESLVVSLLENQVCFVMNLSDKALTLKCNNIINAKGERAIIQIMFSPDFFPTTESIFKKFDFTVCMAAFDCDTKEYIFHKDFYPDVASKTLRFNTGTLYPLNSLIRTTKYKEKGYYIAKPELLKIAFAIVQRGMPNSWEELESQIGGSYGKQISVSSDGIEFNYENVIQLLSEMDCSEFVLKDESESWSRIEHDLIVSACLKRTIPVLKMENNAYALIGEDGYIRDSEFNSDMEIIGKYTTQVDPETYIYGVATANITPQNHYQIGDKIVENINREEVIEFDSDSSIVIMKNSSGYYGKTVTKVLVRIKAKDVVRTSYFGIQAKRCELMNVI